LTAEDVADIESKIGKKRQAEVFLDILPRKPEKSYCKFIAVLRSKEQGHVANILEPIHKITGNFDASNEVFAVNHVHVMM